MSTDHDRSSITRSETVAFVLLVLLFWAYLIWRAVLLPLSQDEANSFWWYVPSGEFMPFDSHLDAGNHFLNSLFGWVGNCLFGPSFLALRLGSLLSFLLFAHAVGRMLAMVRSRWVRWCGLLALLLCPFMHEYFALFRGYGPGVALFMWGVLHLVLFVRTGSTRDGVLIAIAFVLAVFSDLSMLPLCGALAPLPFIIRRLSKCAADRSTPLWPLVAAFVLQAAAYSIAAKVAFQLKDEGLLYLGPGQGLIKVSVVSLCSEIVPFGSAFLAVLMVTLTWGMTGVALWWLVTRHDPKHPLVLLSAMLLLEVAIRLLLFHLLGVNFPQDRAAFQLLLLFLIIIPFALDALAEFIPSARWWAAGTLLLPGITLTTLNAEEVGLQQAVPQQFVRYAAVEQSRLDRPLIVAGGGQLRTSWAFGQYVEDAALQDMEHEQFAQPAQDLRVLPYYLMDRGHAGYRVVDSTSQGTLFLLQRELPLDLRLVLDSVWTSDVIPTGFHGLLELGGGRFAGTMLYVRLTGQMERATDGGEFFVITNERKQNERVFYDDADLMHLRTEWKGESFDVMRRLPALPEANERFCYLWNTTDEPTRISNLRLRLYSLGPS